MWKSKDTANAFGLVTMQRKPKFMAENVDQPVVITLDGTQLEVVKDFQNLGT